jgi:hypothetical protein
MSLELIDDRPRIGLSSIDRASVRALAEAYHQYLGEAAAAGRNPHQIALDWQDEIVAYTASLKDADAQRFGQLYIEETTALTQATIAKTAEINAQVAARQIQEATGASQVATWVSLIAFFIFLITMIKMFK